ncbi:hypothetical protein AncyloWKF20_05655 [Ancylobacter sp. WKF20]|uniref:hypothetical protein n=1 Tax=Ancylobacter sp. WKF20 TaxID=3039801 RepID=UPI0024343E5C|nr:hypothetical protein [Ancylobacter sp. WKF20]WGD31311.1 hypothetical protein AncyloWKF20_05655 [Ancylobacter sp. WKF20]
MKEPEIKWQITMGDQITTTRRLQSGGQAGPSPEDAELVAKIRNVAGLLRISPSSAVHFASDFLPLFLERTALAILRLAEEAAMAKAELNASEQELADLQTELEQDEKSAQMERARATAPLTLTGTDPQTGRVITYVRGPSS